MTGSSPRDSLKVPLLLKGAKGSRSEIIDSSGSSDNLLKTQPLEPKRKTSLLMPFEKVLSNTILPTRRESREDPLQHTPGFSKLVRNSDLYNNHTEDIPQFSFVYRAMAPISEGSERGALFTLIATALGSGVLSLPYAMSRSGILLTFAVLGMACTGAIVGLSLIIMAGRYCDEHSYGSLLGLALSSPKLVPKLVDLMLCVYGIGSCTSLFIFLGDFVPAVCANFGIIVPREYVTISSAILSFPLCIPKQITALRYVSIFSIIALVITTMTVCVQAPHWNSTQPGIVEMAKLSPMGFLETLSICIFGFMCHCNALPVSKQLDHPTSARIVKVATRAALTEIILYLIIGASGYMSWKDGTQGDFLVNYPSKGIPIMICRSMLSVVVFVGIVMNINPTVAALEAFVSNKPTPKAMHYVYVSILLALCCFFGTALQNVALLIGIMGGSFATALMFIFPAIIYKKILWPTQKSFCRVLILGFLILMSILGLCSAGVNVYKVIEGI